MNEQSSAEDAQLVTRIRDALARGEGELGIDVTVIAGVVTLRGVVQTNDRRFRLEALSRVVSQGLSVVNEIAVQPPETPAAPETVR
jgi:osmotically-inducible protein OsmY